MLQTFTATLSEMGFAPETSDDGLQHRWVREQAQIDVLIPDEGVGATAAARAGAGGAPSVEAPGTTQALARSSVVDVLVGERIGHIIRPNLIAALVGKAAARTRIASNQASARHCVDFVILAALISARDFRETELTKKDRRRLSAMIELCRGEDAALAVDEAREALERLARAAGL